MWHRVPLCPRQAPAGRGGGAPVTRRHREPRVTGVPGRPRPVCPSRGCGRRTSSRPPRGVILRSPSPWHRAPITMAVRIAKELEEVRSWKGARDVGPRDRNVRRWEGLLLPNTPPYNMGAFRFELTFSPHHPLEPPRATLHTPIYHPGVDREGRVCQPLTTHEHWAPTTRAIQVLQDLLLLLDSPDTQRVLRPDLARKLQEHPEEFWCWAQEHTRLHAEPRPDPPGP
ncbi:ubiquitin/ISG15-conjugating enzyme E2 L6 isoform X2 [Chiroxiphia lanceolata]|uniref:ubiquitin/ISG15-conjugating enzyme E2 L6 isoform X2 n=1 Tax=Chiroxiphia lanceolata TaxID=296741 RepID=UPI0013CF3B8E|nr:ubiquitin/ISG15-conjugating enzyme E2 L6 isoform X2 [Chiroxiphia lanceolata]